jgi:MerR family transcriptional regulator/heat shock protein HspR
MADKAGRSGGSPELGGATAEDRAVYIISVAAELAGVHPQTLRIYERKGLLSPARTAGNTRRYSERDIERLRMIQRLTQIEGINLAGVKMIVEMESQLDRMRRRLERLDRELERSHLRARDEIERMEPLASVQQIRRTIRELGARAQRSPAHPPSGRGPIAAGPGS